MTPLSIWWTLLNCMKSVFVYYHVYLYTDIHISVLYISILRVYFLCFTCAVHVVPDSLTHLYFFNEENVSNQPSKGSKWNLMSIIKWNLFSFPWTVKPLNRILLWWNKLHLYNYFGRQIFVKYTHGSVCKKAPKQRIRFKPSIECVVCITGQRSVLWNQPCVCNRP